MTKFNNLYEMWRDAWARNALPKGWELAEVFINWAMENKYKIEYGYKGEFTPDSLLKAIPAPQKTEPKPIKKEIKKEVKPSGQNQKTKKV